MKLIELQLKAFGKFHNKTLELQPSINIIEGQNEAGKSTIHAFIGAVLFGLDKESVTDNRYKKYKPWLNRGNFGGAIRFSENDIEYILERNFVSETIELTRVDSGNTISGDEAQRKLTEILGGLTEIGYINTVSIDQMKGTTDETIADELRANLDNLCRARSTSIDFKEAEKFLKKLRDELEYKLLCHDNNKYEYTLAASKENERELNEAISVGWSNSRELREAAEQKKKAYDQYESKREELLSRRENIDREQEEIRNQQDVWSRTEDKYKRLLERKKNRTEMLVSKGKDPVYAFGPNLVIWWVLMAVSIVAAVACGLLYFFWQKVDYLLYGLAGAGAVAIIILIINLCRWSAFKKKKIFYRTLLERKSRQEEYKRAGKALDEARNAVFKEMSEEQTGEYMRACERFDAAERQFEISRKQMNEAAAGLDNIKVQLYEANRAEKDALECRKKLEAVNLAWEHLYSAGEISVRTFGEELKKKAGEYIEIITEGKYNGITQNSYGAVCLEGRNGQAEVSSVSRGTMEQVYLCLRLSATSLLSPSVNLPLILDDTFAYYDDERTRRALELLKNCGHQVILMTCQSREKKILKL